MNYINFNFNLLWTASPIKMKNIGTKNIRFLSCTNRKSYDEIKPVMKQNLMLVCVQSSPESTHNSESNDMCDKIKEQLSTCEGQR